MRKKRVWWPLYLAVAAGAVLTVFSCCVFGSSEIPLEKVIGVLGNKLFCIPDDCMTAADAYVIWNLRFPRALLALAVGGSLAVSGAAMQAVTGNVMADPYVLGISSGAMAFVSVGFLFGGAWTALRWFIPTLAFIGAVVSLLLVFAVGGFSKNAPPAKLVLSGMAVSFTLNAVGQYCIYRQESSLGANSIVSWTMGSLGGARWDDMLVTVIGCLMGLAYFMFKARSFDLMTLGDDTAVSLGVNIAKAKRTAMLAVSLMCGLAVAGSGIIGLVGFIVPHIVRFVAGSEHRKVFPMAFAMGGIFLAIMDILARTAMAPQELPVGIFTALCGGPYFIWLLKRKSGRSER